MALGSTTRSGSYSPLVRPRIAGYLSVVLGAAAWVFGVAGYSPALIVAVVLWLLGAVLLIIASRRSRTENDDATPQRPD